MSIQSKQQLLTNHGIPCVYDGLVLMGQAGYNADGSEWWEDITSLNRSEVYMWLGY